MDVSALYSSISKDLATRTIIKLMKESKLSWDNVCDITLGRYIELTIVRSEFKNRSLYSNQEVKDYFELMGESHWQFF